MTGPAIVLDLETRPDPLIAQSDAWWTRVRQGIEAPSNYKDPVKIQSYMDEQELKARERMALSPRTGLIACLGFADKTGVVASRVEEENRANERELLEWFFDNIPDAMTRVVGWNIRRFDMPFIAARCLVHQIETPVWWPTPRNYKLVVDLMDLLGGGSLDEWSFLLRGEFKEVSGADLLKLPLDELYEHLLDDLSLTQHIALWTETQWRE